MVAASQAYGEEENEWTGCDAKVWEVRFVIERSAEERTCTSWCFLERIVESWREVRPEASVRRIFIVVIVLRYWINSRWISGTGEMFK